jgi:sterol desaturase/sphingolipid hydroxylase (fatty acid hydroxylase superfamily)
MLEYILSNESEVRIGAFAGLLVLFAGLEALLPKRQRMQKRLSRWFTNLSMVVISNLLVRLLFPIAAMGMAVYAAQKGWGLLNFADLPIGVDILLSLILLDFAIYWQHVASHKFPVLWALHKMHHADRDIDATTGIRFHPVEIILSMLYKMAIIMILGPSAVAVLLFEIILNGSAMFNHANLRLPRRLDQLIRYVFVTPDMHRVHHSIIKTETDSNYGFNLAIWDRMFGSYIDQPHKGHQGMTIGLPGHQTDNPSRVVWSLLFPFNLNR